MNAFIPQVVQDLLAQPLNHYRDAAPSGTATPPQGDAATHVAFILDRSGSMEHGKDSTIEGYNEQAQAVKTGAEQAGGTTTYTEAQFNAQVQIRRLMESLSALQPLTAESYQPQGGTALLDAVGATVAALLQKPGVWDPTTAFLVTVFTDGEENASRVYRAETIRDMIERLEATGRWTFALVGPKDSVLGLARTLAIHQSNVAGYDESSLHEKRAAFSRVNQANTVYFSRKMAGAMRTNGLFSPDE